MPGRLRLLAFLAVILLAALGSAFPHQARATRPAAPGLATLRIVPQVTTLSVGDTTTVEVLVVDAEPLAGVALYIDFDASRLRVVESAPGVTIASTPFYTPTFVRTSQVDNTAGLIAYEAVHSSAPYPSGAGPLIRLSFQAVQPGEAQLRFRAGDTALISADSLVLPLTLEDRSLTIDTPLSCAQVLRNPSFEEGTAPWMLGGSTQVFEQMGHTGTHSAWLGGYEMGYDGWTDSLWQAFSIGSEAVNAELQYWYWAHCEDAACSSDTLRADLLDDQGRLLQTLDTHSGADADSAWHPSPVIDLAAYRGQTVRVRFELAGSGTASFMVDDVNVNICPPPSQPPALYTVHLPLVLNASSTP
jgi:hypothetical protein